MQFHHHGYVSTDPRIKPAAGVGIDRPAELPDEVDVLIVGSGPAGMLTAAQMAQFPSITTALVERRDGRLVIGQADGIQARSVETFQAFGFAERIIQEAYRITEMCFWKPDPENPDHIVRTARTPDDPTGISEFPHLIVNQARVLDYYAEAAAHGPARLKPNYGWEFQTLEVTNEGDYPVKVTLTDEDGNERIISAKYVLGADGARSRVRDSIGAQHVGGVSYHAWGVMDVLANTDFPDVRTKCAIQSKHGSILHIPREGGYLFRMYVDLGEVAADDAGAVRKTPLDTIIAKANEIITPYSLDVKDVAWWSVYEVGHRVTDRFDDVPVEQAGERMPHVFIAGDACHTHSAKAGQGMNVSMQDGFNLGWKLAHVLEGRSPESLLSTYTAERQVIAQNLIDFDREWSSMMAAKSEELESPTALEEFYVKTIEFPAGFMTEYPESLIVGNNKHQDLAKGFTLGKRFKSVIVNRVCDGNPKHLGHLHQADGRWRIYAFGDKDSTKLHEFGEWLGTNPESPVLAHRKDGEDINALFDVKAIYQTPYDEVDITKAPAIFKPENGPFGLVNLENVFAADVEESIFDIRELSKDGVVVVVRPDQYVAHVLPLDATDELAAFFKPIFTV
ncbi:FAD-binding monooxygenase [Micrococcoides hystricis]|uniref:FAD-binding monooxygenase n=1 Tax=Micrococcoides hystricis TaxID=1572761 RepID=A0ABV6PCD2_9MICC